MSDVRSIAERFGLPICEEIESFAFVRDKASIIPYLFAKQKRILPLSVNEKGVTVAVADPLDLDSLEELRLMIKKAVIPVYSPKEVIEAAIERCYSHKDAETKRFFSDLEKESLEQPSVEQNDEYDLLEQSEENPVVRLVNTLLSEAIQQGASDVHFEPTDIGLSIRYRIDGVLQKRHVPPKEYQQQILTRIKVMAKMDIAEHRLPQDGRIKLKVGGRGIDFRVSTLPIVHGERIVLRILDKGNVLLGLDRIGMPEAVLKAFRKLIHTPEGIVLVTGPTGSGKTTTLYSALSEVNAAEMNIVTIEDPVEIRLAGISQMHVNRKIELDFSKGLRHILRQDPDVIMIGEIRDKETAEIAIQSSLTGHLVLSTLHTNDAPSALTRLSDMGIEPYLLASSILGVLAQRLVRRICPYCKTGYHSSKEELQELGLQKEEIHGGTLFRGAGCGQCFNTGYKGRCGIYELMMVSSKIKAQVLRSQDAEELKKAALSQHMVSLFERGVELVAHGITTSAEVLRVTRIAEVEN
jgi:general secretion pathway protein E